MSLLVNNFDTLLSSVGCKFRKMPKDHVVKASRQIDQVRQRNYMAYKQIKSLQSRGKNSTGILPYRLLPGTADEANGDANPLQQRLVLHSVLIMAIS